MQKNEYRRALILLRPLDIGWRGHARLERRTLMGSLQFTVFGPGAGERLLAVMIGRRRDRLRAHPLGELRNGGRGQAGLRCEFDPRDMGGMTLEQYALAGVARWDGQGWALVMAGFPNGSREIDWAEARDAVSKLMDGSRRTESAESGQNGEKPEGAETRESAAGEDADRPDDAAGNAGAAPGGEAPPVLPESEDRYPEDAEKADQEDAVWPEEIKTPEEAESAPLLQRPAYPEWSKPDGTDTPAGQVSEEDEAFRVPRTEDIPPAGGPEDMEIPAEDMEIPAEYTGDPAEETEIPAEDMDAPAEEEEPLDIPAEDWPVYEPSDPEELDLPAGNGGEAEADGADSALDALGLLEDEPWPDTVEPLRALFAARRPEAEGPLEGFVFVRSEMPEGSGYAYALTGLRSEDGRAVEVAYAVPGPYAAEPPAGLEEYRWEKGFWVYRRPCGGA